MITRKVIDWPSLTWHTAYWVVDHDDRPHHGYTPLAGPFRTRAEAHQAMLDLDLTSTADVPWPGDDDAPPDRDP